MTPEEIAKLARTARRLGVKITVDGVTIEPVSERDKFESAERRREADRLRKAAESARKRAETRGNVRKRAETPGNVRKAAEIEIPPSPPPPLSPAPPIPPAPTPALFPPAHTREEPKPAGKRKAAVEIAADEADALALPLNLRTDDFRKAWALFCQHRREMALRDPKKPWTATAARATLQRCSEHGPAAAAAAITQAVSSQWQSLHFDAAPAPAPRQPSLPVQPANPARKAWEQDPKQKTP